MTKETEEQIMDDAALRPAQSYGKSKCPFCGDGRFIGEPAHGHTKHACQHCSKHDDAQAEIAKTEDSLRDSIMDGLCVSRTPR